MPCPARGVGHGNAVSLRFALTFNNWYKIEDCSSYLPTHKPFIELLINDIIAETQKKNIKVMTVFVTKNQSNAKQLETELTKANFDTRP